MVKNFNCIILRYTNVKQLISWYTNDTHIRIFTISLFDKCKDERRVSNYITFLINYICLYYVPMFILIDLQ